MGEISCQNSRGMSPLFNFVTISKYIGNKFKCNPHAPPHHIPIAKKRLLNTYYQSSDSFILQCPYRYTFITYIKSCQAKRKKPVFSPKERLFIPLVDGKPPDPSFLTSKESLERRGKIAFDLLRKRGDAAHSDKKSPGRFGKERFFRCFTRYCKKTYHALPYNRFCRLSRFYGGIDHGDPGLERLPRPTGIRRIQEKPAGDRKSVV